MKVTWALTDLHGRYDVWEKIKEYIGKDDVIYYLGDATDRGPSGWKLFTTLIDNPQVIYLRGNHEQMLLDAIEEFNIYKQKGEKFDLLIWNGGNKTWNDWRSPEVNHSYYYQKLKTLPYVAEYINKKNQRIILTHAGLTPSADHDYMNPDTFGKFDYIWDRNHFTDEWPNDKEFEKVFVVHGHTPIRSLKKKVQPSKENWLHTEAFEYCNGHKFCLDTLTVQSGGAFLFNLDNFTTQTFFA